MKSKRQRRIEALDRMMRFPLNAPDQPSRARKKGVRRSKEDRESEIANLKRKIGV